MPKKPPNKLISFMVANKMRTSTGERMEWHNHKFMLQPLSDMYPLQTHRKCAQVGFSEGMIIKAIYLARNGLNICYTMPSASAMADFQKTKFDGLLQSNKFLKSFCSGNSTEKIIETNDGRRKYIHLVGAYNSESSANKENTSKGVSFSSDVNAHDESDRSDFYILDQLQSRQDDSDYRYRWYFSNPTYPEVGTDKFWQESTQYHWFITCNKCKHKQYLDWYKLDEYKLQKKANHCYIDPNKKEYICSGCSQVLTQDSILDGEWVGAKDNAKFHGYWYSQMMYVKNTCATILDKEQERSPSVFNQFVLGKPYINADNFITAEVLYRNIQPRATPPQVGRVAMGIDVRIDEFEYVLRDEQGLFMLGRTKDINLLGKLRQKYKAYTIIDFLPLRGLAERFVNEDIGRSFRATFKPDSDQDVTVKFGTKNDRSIVAIRREEAFDKLTDAYMMGKLPISLPPTELKEFADEWQRLVRTTEVDSNGNERPVWVKTGESDFPFADLYSWVALNLINKGTITFLSPDSQNSIRNQSTLDYPMVRVLE